ncbi:hypothetical protein CISG_08101 [Coccidioides immitis RMSCC 3703]|uniref:Uncharacterized protein n=1 Tax=Coccidioides immitis RMSCC 3703 TaxID=454286 RepID=A0A0J8R4W6_COCIT|nr:hypothetical protein CISG_08101 [Coccidioides immitis RMSCC 3703]
MYKHTYGSLYGGYREYFFLVKVVYSVQRELSRIDVILCVPASKKEAWNLSSQVSERGSALLLGRNSSPLSRPARAKMDDKDAENLVTRNKKGKANVQKYAGILSRIQTKEKLRDPGKPKMGPNIKPLAHPVLSKRGHAMLHGSTECRKSQLYTLS